MGAKKQKVYSDFGTVERSRHDEGVVEETMQAGVKRRRYPTAWELMASKGTITDAMRHAAERFNSDFELAGFHGRFSGMPLDRVDGGGEQSVTESSVLAKDRVRSALDAVGGLKTQSVLWWCVGIGASLKEVEIHIGKSATVIGGILFAALESLARHYGYE